jgi:hypothetical protein
MDEQNYSAIERFQAKGERVSGSEATTAYIKWKLI